MPLEIEKKIRRKLEVAPIDAYAPLSRAEIDEGAMPPEAHKYVQDYLGQDFLKGSVEIVSVVQTDGVQDFLACSDMKDEKKCHGILLDTFGGAMLGETTFFGSYKNETNLPIQVMTTSTENDVKGVGLGTKRLMTINEYCKARFGVGLCSSADPASGAERIWKDLTANNITKRIRLPDGTKRYCFI